MAIVDPYRPAYFGKGFQGEGEYTVYEGLKKGKAGIAWVGMLRRCLDEKYQSKNQSYIGCSVDPKWYNFQVFADWFYSQKAIDTKCVVDKDILFDNNKVYSEETCVLVPSVFNAMFIRSVGALGVKPSPNGTFRGSVRFNGKHIRETFKTYDEARQFYLDTKHKLVVNYIKSNIEVIDDRIFSKFIVGEV